MANDVSSSPALTPHSDGSATVRGLNRSLIRPVSGAVAAPMPELKTMANWMSDRAQPLAASIGWVEGPIE